jgi:HK97 family phage major capsid protein
MDKNLEVELKSHLAAAKVLCDQAESAGRDFTDAEREQVGYHLAESRRLKAIVVAPLDFQARQKARDAALTAAVLELTGEGRPGGVSGAVKAGSWGQALDNAVSSGTMGGGMGGRKDLITPGGAIGVPGVIAGMAPVVDRVESILQLIPHTTLSGTDAFSFLRETQRVQNAAPVAPGRPKPTSYYGLERIDDRTRVIAHLSEPIPRQYVDTVPLLRQYLDQVLKLGYLLELEYQVIQGNGAGENFTGLLNTPGILLQAFNVDLLTTCRNAITTQELLSIVPTAFVFNPTDWETFELLVNLDGEYLLKDATNVVPIDRARRRLWGYPVALTTGIPQSTGLLVDFAGSTQLWEQEQVRVDWSEAFHVAPDNYDAADSTGFERNLLRFRCEGRAGFGCKRGAGVVEIELDSGT